MSDGPRQQIHDDESQLAVSGLAEAIKGVSDPRDERRMIFSKGENTRHVRHEQVLNRWPVLTEGWALGVERTRLGAIDRTPGNATFGR